MATAYTSKAGGNFNATGQTTWNEVGAPTSAGDTFRIQSGHSVTIVAENGAAVVLGAGTIDAGGILTNNVNQTQTFCAAITNNGTFVNNSGMTFRTSATTTCNNGSSFTNQPTATYQWDLVAQGGGGLFTNAGAVCILDGIVQGTAGLEAYLYISDNNLVKPTAAGSGYAVSLGNTLLTINRMYRYSSSYTAALNCIGFNRYVKGNAHIGTVNFTNCVGASFLYNFVGTFDVDTGTLTGIADATVRGINLSYGNFIGGTYNFSGAANYLFYAVNYAQIFGGTWNAIATGTANVFYLDSSVVLGGTFNITTSSSAIAMPFYGVILDGGTWNITATSTNDIFYLANTYVGKNFIALIGGAGGTGNVSALRFNYGSIWDGGYLKISSKTTWGVTFAEGYRPGILRRGVIWIDNTCSGIGIIILSASGSTNIQVEHTPEMHIINETSGTPIVYWYSQTEPFIYITSLANKTYSVDFPMYPFNWSDFTTTGTVTNNTTLGVITMTGAATLTTPKVKPWDVANWGHVTWGITGGTWNDLKFKIFRRDSSGVDTQQFYEDQVYSDQNYNLQIRMDISTSGYTHLGQTIICGQTGTCPYVALKLQKTGSPSGILTLEIYGDDGGGKPTGAALASGTKVASSLGTENQMVFFKMGTPPTLTATVVYHLVLSYSWAASDTDYIRVGADNSSPTYAGGGIVYSTDNKASWTKSAATDLIFTTTTSNSAGSAWVTLFYNVNTTGYGCNLQSVTGSSDGLDLIQFYVETLTGTNSMASIFMSKCGYADINGGYIYIDSVDMEYV